MTEAPRTHTPRLTLRRALPWLLLVALLAFLVWKLRTSHFDWHGFLRSLRTADLRLILLAILVIYSQNLLRALRWSVFLRPAFRAADLPLPPTPWYRLIGSQFIGFTGLAIFGRIGELIRPLLVARRTGLTFPSQVAVVTVERVFDLGAFVAIFALNLLLSPSLNALPFHERFHAVGYAIAALTLIVALFVAAVRLAGTFLAACTQRLFGGISPSFASAGADKILAFRDGLNVIDTLPDFLLAALLSLLLWAVIALSYILVMRAFPPPVHSLTVSHILVMMGFSIVGSIVQLPGVGGGAQVGTISALTLLFRIPSDLAVSAGLLLWLVTTMSIIPAGLLYAKLENISLTQVARRSEATEADPLTPSTSI